MSQSVVYKIQYARSIRMSYHMQLDSQYTGQHAFLAHNPLRSGKHVAYVILCCSHIIEAETDD